MGFQQTLEKHLTKFGSNNSPTVVAMGIAMAKGVFRPAFTMMDKDESMETKRYTALREGLTEMIAIPIYYLSGRISNIAAKQLAKPKYFMPKRIYNEYKKGNDSEEVKNAVSHAKKLAEDNLPKLKTTTAFVGVCASALFIIPLICSVTIKPIMNSLNKNSETSTNNSQKEPVFKSKRKVLKHSVFNYYKNQSYGMKVGGV